MTLSQLSRRLGAIEEAVSTIPKSCFVCRDWPDLVVYDEYSDGTKDVWSTNAWPVDTLQCPNCGRGPGMQMAVVLPDRES